jgi:cytosine permease
MTIVSDKCTNAIPDNAAVGNAAQNDYELEAVPRDKRRSFWSITVVWTGYVFLVTSMMAGGGLASGMTFSGIVTATIAGNLFLSAVAVAISYIACTTGLTFALITRHSCGFEGSRVASLFAPVINLGWYTIQSALYGHLIAQILGLGQAGEYIAMAGSALGMGIFAIIGMEALTVLGLVAIPAIIFLSIATAMRAIAGLDGGMAAIMSITPAIPMAWTDGVILVIGTWIFSAARASPTSCATQKTSRTPS